MIVERKASYVKFLTLRHLVERMQNELYLLVQEKKKKKKRILSPRGIA